MTVRWFDFLRPRPTLRTRMVMGVGVVVFLLLLAVLGFFQQLNVLRDAIQDLREENSRLALALDTAYQATRLVVIVQEKTAEHIPAIFIEEVSAVVQALEAKQNQLNEYLLVLPQGDPLRHSIEETKTSLWDMINIAEGTIRHVEDGNWPAVQMRADLLLQRQNEVEWQVYRLVAQARDRHIRAEDQATRAMQGMVSRLVPLAVLAVVVATGVVFVTVRSVTVGVEQLGHWAGRLAEGRFEERIPVVRKDELGQLAKAFNAMADELEEAYTSLERQVAERTADLARRSVQLEAAAQVAREAAAIHDIGQLLDETVRLISERFGFYHAGIFLLNEAEEYAVLQAASSEGGQRMLARRHSLKVGEVGIVGYAAGAGKPRIALDVGEDAVFFDNPDLPHTRSEMALPLKVRDRVIGVLDVQSTQAGAFSDEDVAILQTLADQVAMAIENARLLEEAQERFREVNALLGRHSREGWKRLATERPGWGYTYNGVEILPCDSTAAPPVEPQLKVPLQVRGETFGHVNLVLGDRPVTPDAVALARDIAEQASQALESARLFQETQRTLREVENLYNASRAIGAAASTEEIGQALVDYAVTSGVDAARVILFEYDEPVGNGDGRRSAHLVVCEGWTADDRPVLPCGTRFSMEKYPLKDFMDASEPIIVEDVLAHPRVSEIAHTLIASGLRSFAMVPIAVGERWFGVIALGRNEPSTLTREFIRSHRTLAGQAATALESMRLLENTRRRAEREQLTSEITARIRETLDVETVLKTAVHEIGHRLGLAALDVRLGVDKDLLTAQSETKIVEREKEQ